MKKLLLMICLLSPFMRLNAQVCKIKIYYDDNGNRTQRTLECTGGKPAPTDTPPTNTSVANPDNALLSIEPAYQVYPNPTQDRVSVKLNAALLAKPCSIFMTDISGKVVYQNKTVDQPVSEINLHGLADGTYIIRITAGMDRYSVKIVKQTGKGY